MMEKKKLVSVITGTYNRPRELQKAIQSVRDQDYPNIEHCIVHDGPASDDVTRLVHVSENMNYKHYVPIVFVETGRQWSHFLTNSISAVPFQVAQWLASGDYIMWLADDEEITSDHVSSLVQLLEEKDVDFVYSKTQIWPVPGLKPLFMPSVIGESTPKCGNITQALFRAELLDYAGFEVRVGSGTDWHQISSWIDAGASYAFLDRVTHTHRVDKWGDRDARKERQPLRGQPVHETVR